MCFGSVERVDDDVQLGVRKRPTRPSSHRNSRLIVQHGSNQAISVPVRPGQIVRVSSTQVHRAASPVAITRTIQRTSRILADEQYNIAHPHSISPPVVLHAPTPPSVSPRVSHLSFQNQPSPRSTQQSFTHVSRHSSRSRHSRHSRSRSSGGRHSRPQIVDPPAPDTLLSRSLSDAGQRQYSPGPTTNGRSGRTSMPNITHQSTLSREKSRERTSTGVSYLDPLTTERDIGRIQQGLRREDELRIKDGQVKGLLGGDDQAEVIKIYGRNPRASGGRLGAYGEKVVMSSDGRRYYGSQ